MRVLWTSPVVMPALAQAMKASGYWSGTWVAALADALTGPGAGVELGILAAHTGIPEGRYDVGGAVHYIIPNGELTAAETRLNGPNKG